MPHAAAFNNVQPVTACGPRILRAHKDKQPDMDRISVRSRPRGLPIMHQTWDDLLFLHWKVRPDVLRPHVPEELAIDSYENHAWIGVTPFSMRGVRPVLTPPLPVVSRSFELNVRTYVHDGDTPGVWFFSLDASNPLAVYLARLGFSLPYHRASMTLERSANGAVTFTSTRLDAETSRADFAARWRIIGIERQARVSSLEFFLVERYSLYVIRQGRLKRARIFHHPWTIRDAELFSWRSSLLASNGFPEQTSEPHVLAQAAALDVEIWPLEVV